MVWKYLKRVKDKQNNDSASSKSRQAMTTIQQ